MKVLRPEGVGKAIKRLTHMLCAYRAPINGGVKSSFVIGFLATVAFLIGTSGVLAGTTVPSSIPLKKLSNASVFAAAPVSVRRVVPETLIFFKRNEPPPYMRLAFMKSQSSQVSPSRIWPSFTIPMLCKVKLLSGGTMGTEIGRAHV